ncbi:MAG: hypothetical protein WDA16_00380 [Candidatus Thermoplasmatota archaeon]
MRVPVVVLVVLLLVPSVGSLWRAPPVQASALPSDLSDGDLLRLLASHTGYRLSASTPTRVPPGLTLVGELQGLALRMGAQPLGAADVAAFASLDPRVAGPTLLLLVAVSDAWDARDAAFAKLTLDEQRELAALMDARAPSEPRSAREAALAANVDKKAMIEGTIILMDTLENIVLPQLQAAARNGAWPPVAVADPVGVLRLGSPGTDVERLNRLVQIDPNGNDVYWNNAGGGSAVPGINPPTPRFPVALSVDLNGNDYYRNNYTGAQGGGVFGVGVLLDLTGDDYYYCSGVHCAGGADLGVGLLRDYAGNDSFFVGQTYSMGGAYEGWGVLRNDAGNDQYTIGGYAGGMAEIDGALGLLWDRAGTDKYLVWAGSAARAYGWSESGGYGWFVDEGNATDYYEQEHALNYAHGCNDCYWQLGEPGIFMPSNGRGLDNQGGLAGILATPNAVFPPPGP